MRNRFNLNESEKNRIRGLHKEHSIIKEQPQMFSCVTTLGCQCFEVGGPMNPNPSGQQYFSKTQCENDFSTCCMDKWYCVAGNSGNNSCIEIPGGATPPPNSGGPYPVKSFCESNCTNPIPGCTDSTATNYNSNATVDDGSCTYSVPGCTDSTATNYNSNATVDDGSCTHQSTKEWKCRRDKFRGKRCVKLQPGDGSHATKQECLDAGCKELKVKRNRNQAM